MRQCQFMTDSEKISDGDQREQNIEIYSDIFDSVHESLDYQTSFFPVSSSKNMTIQ